jgi:superfamily II DNA or RNA helicase
MFAMLILHLARSQEQWLLWAETEAAPKRRKSSKKYPYGASAALVQAAVATSFPVEPELPKCRVVALLPTCGGVALPSSPLLAELPSHQEGWVAERWDVEAVLLSDQTAVDIISTCRGRKVLSPGVVVGDDLAHWGKVLDLASRLVAQGSYLPGLRLVGKRYLSVWEPVSDGAAREQLLALRRQMPGVAFALSQDKQAIDRPDTLSEALRSLVDNLVRSANQGAPWPSRSSLHDRWLSALVAPTGELTGSTAELSRLLVDIGEWKRRFTYLSSAPLKLVMRVSEEAEDPGYWRLDFLVIDLADPSTSYQLGEAWNEQGLRWREFLLMAVAQALDVCPMLAECLQAPIPRSAVLTTESLYTFLMDYAPLLMRTGFSLQLPGWWTGQAGRQTVRLRANVKRSRSASRAGLTLDALLQVDWQAALGDELLTADDLQALATTKVPIVRLRGQWVHVERDQLAQLLKVLRGKDRKLALDAVLRMAASGEDQSGLAVEQVTADPEVGRILDVLTGRQQAAALPVPAGLAAQLRPYQQAGYQWLAFLSRFGIGACLADDMGLGKTIQTLALLQHRFEQGETSPALLACPTSLLLNWQKEAERFTPNLQVHLHHGAGRVRDADRFREQACAAQLVVTSYSLLHRDEELFSGLQWSGLILDESQNIKNAETKAARAVRRLSAAYRLALTGTPLENHVGELWSLLDWLNPGWLGNQAEFRRRYFLPIQAYGDREAAAKLRALAHPFILRRLKSDRSIIDDLPDKIETKLFCPLTVEQAALYGAVVQDVEETLADVDGIQRKGLVLATLTKLKQLCNHPALLLKDGLQQAHRSGKLGRLLELVAGILDHGEKVLVFTQFVEMGEIIVRQLAESLGQEVLWLHGSVSKEARERMVEKFQQDAAASILVLSLRAGGTGLNLTSATHVVHFDRWWNPAVEDQATDRAYRIGQKSSVQVHKFICAGTLEEKIDRLIESKRRLAGDIVTAGEAWVTELSTQELQELWRLDQTEAGAEHVG